MVKDYLRLICGRAFKSAVRDMIAHSIGDLVKKLVGGLVILGLLYWFVERQSPGSHLYEDEVLMVQLTMLAAIIGAFAYFLFSALIVAPYQLWKEAISQVSQKQAPEWEEIAAQKLEAEIKAKADRMHKRLATRNHSTGAPDDYMAALWDAEQRGEHYDDYHKFTFERPKRIEERSKWTKFTQLVKKWK